MLLAALVAIVPLIITPGLLFYFDVTPKLIVLMTGLAIALPWTLARRFPAGPLAWRLYTLLAAQALSLAISTLGSRQIGLSLWGSNWRSFGLVTQLVLLLFTVVTFAYSAGDSSRIRNLLRAVTIGGSCAAAYGVFQYFGWDPWQPAGAYHAGEGIWTIVRPPATLGHADYFATYLLLPVFAAAQMSRRESGAWRVAGLCAAVLTAGAIVLSGTRGALAGLIVGGLFLLVRVRPRHPRRLAAAAAGTVVLAALFYVSPAGAALRSRVHWATDDKWGGARLLLWRDSLHLAAAHVVIGAGPETFPVEFPQYQSVELAHAYPDFYYESPHNILLDALVGQGLVGAAILVALIALGLWAGFEAGEAGAFLTAALAATVVASMFAAPIMVTGMYFYLLIALLVGRRTERARPGAETGGRAPVSAAEDRFPHAGAGKRRWVGVTAAVPVSAMLIVLALRLTVADRALGLARHDAESGRIAEAVAHYRDGRRWGLAADIWFARSLAEAAPQEAIAAAERATRGEDAQNGWYTLAWLYARQGDIARTEQALRATLRCAPNWFKPHWMLSQVLWRAHREPEALAEAELAARLNAGKNPEVERTAMALRQENRAQ